MRVYQVKSAKGDTPSLSYREALAVYKNWRTMYLHVQLVEITGNGTYQVIKEVI